MKNKEKLVGKSARCSVLRARDSAQKGFYDGIVSVNIIKREKACRDGNMVVLGYRDLERRRNENRLRHRSQLRRQEIAGREVSGNSGWTKGELAYSE